MPRLSLKRATRLPTHSGSFAIAFLTSGSSPLVVIQYGVF